MKDNAEHSYSDKERIEKDAEYYAFAVPFDGAENFYDKAKYEGYIAGATAERERIVKVITNSEGQNHLQWIYNRLYLVYGSDEDFDYMIKFKAIIESLKSDSK